MSLRTYALGFFAGLMGAVALVGGAAVAHADPDDLPPVIIDELIVVVPPLTQDARELTPGHENSRGPSDWSGSGMYCQNRTVKCQKMGF